MPKHVGRDNVARDDGLAAFFFDLAADQGHEQARNLRRLLGNPEAYSPQCMRDPVVQDFEVQPPVFESLEEPFIATTLEQLRIVKLVERLGPDYGVNLEFELPRFCGRFSAWHSNAFGFRRWVWN